MQIGLGHGADVDEHAAELAAAAALLLERFLELLLRDQLLLEQQVAETNALAMFGRHGHLSAVELPSADKRSAAGCDDPRPVVVVVDDDRPQQDHELGLRFDLSSAAEQALEPRHAAEHTAIENSMLAATSCA